MITTLFAGLAFLFPLAMYLLFLAYLNARRQATLIPGPWDFVGVLLALAGFVLAGGWLIINGLHEQWWSALLVQVRRRELQGPGGSSMFLYLWGLRVCYFLFVLSGAALLLWRRRAVTVIYNCETNLFLDTLTDAIHRRGLEATLTGNQFVIRPLSVSGGGAATVDGPGHVPVPGLPQVGVVEVDPFPAMRHITLRWKPADSLVRREIEAELARRFSEIEPRPNSVAAWMLTAASCLIVVMLFSLGLVVFLQEMRP